MSDDRARQPCAGGIVHDGDGRLLLIRRGRPPALGSWSVPGGRCLPGETPEQACVREVAEETGLAVAVVRHVGRVERDAPDGTVYVIDDFACRLVESAVVDGVAVDGVAVDGVAVDGAPVAGDDADDARWVDRDELATLELSPGLFDCLRAWDLLPR